MRGRRATRSPSSDGDATVLVERGPTGLVWFELCGRSGSHLARAAWDGRSLRMNRSMRDAVALSMAVETLFAPTSGRRPPSFTDRPMALVTELVRSLDEVHRIEYSSRCRAGVRHRRWVPGDPAGTWTT